MKGVPKPENFVDPAILQAGTIRIAALDGDDADPANGLTLEPGLLARSLRGEMAYRLAGRAGYERVSASDEKHIAPGFEALVRLRKPAFAETVPAPKSPEQIPLELADESDSREGNA